MDYGALLEERKQKQRELVQRANALADERARLLEEALRLEGEIRLLKELVSWSPMEGGQP
jgi:hypothetical protein